jgi:hypothetical protein
MMARARDLASAGGHEPRIDPAESVFMSILLGHEKELAELRKRIGGLASSGGEEVGVAGQCMSSGVEGGGGVGGRTLSDAEGGARVDDNPSEDERTRPKGGR